MISRLVHVELTLNPRLINIGWVVFIEFIFLIHQYLSIVFLSGLEKLLLVCVPSFHLRQRMNGVSSSNLSEVFSLNHLSSFLHDSIDLWPTLLESPGEIILESILDSFQSSSFFFLIQLSVFVFVEVFCHYEISVANETVVVQII